MANRYFKAETTKDGQTRVSHRQTSVVRTNCMDCLDRTNVVQSVISRWVLTRQLQELGILSPNESFESHEQFEALFRNGNDQFLWMVPPLTCSSSLLLNHLSADYSLSLE